MEGINRRSNHRIDNRVNYILALLGIEPNYRLSISRLFLVKRIMGLVGRGQFFRWKKLVGARRASRDNKDIMSTIGERVTRCSKRLRTAYFINVPRFDRLVFDFLVSLPPSESRFSILASIELTRASLFPGREREKERDCKLIGVSFSNSEFLSTARSDQKFKSKPSVDSDFLS